MPPVLRVEGLCKTYGHGDIFRDVTFTLKNGETLGFFGMSGSGKSTLGRCVLCLEKPTLGKVWYRGIEISSLNGKKLESVRPGMQMIFQHPEMSLNPRMRLFESVTEPLSYHSGRPADEIFEELMPLITATGLRRELFSCYPNQLSGGEIQRAMLIRIYSLSPELVMADEPTSMLDMSVQAQVLALMKDLQKKNNTACIFVSHDPGVMSAVCDRVGVIEGAEVTFMNMEEFSGYCATVE